MSVLTRRSVSGRVAVVTLVGDHDIATSREVRRALLDTRGTAVTVLDLTPCTFVDSTVLGVIAGASRRLAEAGGRLIGVNPAGVVQRALKITGIDDLLQATQADVNLLLDRDDLELAALNR